MVFRGSEDIIRPQGGFMEEREVRLGDLLEDYCPRCRLLLDHAVASMVGPQVAKVICRICYTEHAFHHGQAGKKKTSPRATLFDQVLAKVSSSEDGEANDSPDVQENSPETTGAKGKSRRGKKKQ